MDADNFVMAQLPDPHHLKNVLFVPVTTLEIPEKFSIVKRVFKHYRCEALGMLLEHGDVNALQSWNYFFIAAPQIISDRFEVLMARTARYLDGHCIKLMMLVGSGSRLDPALLSAIFSRGIVLYRHPLDFHYGEIYVEDEEFSSKGKVSAVYSQEIGYFRRWGVGSSDADEDGDDFDRSITDLYISFIEKVSFQVWSEPAQASTAHGANPFSVPPNTIIEGLEDVSLNSSHSSKLDLEGYEIVELKDGDPNEADDFKSEISRKASEDARHLEDSEDEEDFEDVENEDLNVASSDAVLATSVLAELDFKN